MELSQPTNTKGNNPNETEESVTIKVGMDDFELLKVLGSGGFGKVVQVRKKDDQKVYAMKMIKKSKIKESTKRIQDVTFS